MHMTPQPMPGRQKWVAVMGLGMGVFMATLDASIVNISLPTLVKVFHTNLAVIQWVILSYTLVLTSLMLGVARLGDMYDKKRLYTAGLALFTLASLLCALAPSVEWLIGFRALQGLGAVLTQALGSAIVTEIFPPSERGRALGLIGSTVSVGIALGPPLGGLLIGLAGWQSIFLVNIPVGIAAVWVVTRFTPSSPTRPGQRFDAAGAVILFVTLSTYAGGMTLAQGRGFGSPAAGGLLVVALVGLAAFLFVESRVRQPMVDLSMFRNPLFSLNLLMGSLVFIVMSGAFIMPFFLQLVKGFSTQEIGLMLMVNPIVTGLLAPVAGSLSDRYGSRGISLVGLLFVIAGCLAVSTLHEGVGALGFVLRWLPVGIGVAMFQSPNNSAIMGAVPRERLGVASGLLALSRTLGTSTGLPLMGTLFTGLVLAAGGLAAGGDVTSAPAAALVAGINGTYRIAAVIMLGATLLASLALYLDSRRKHQASLEQAVR
jgi:EmrB/QacA subfamily drug resistance transporter